MFEVIVGNIGLVHTGEDEAEAWQVYTEYQTQSLSGYGRASGEFVMLLKDGEPIAEHRGTQEEE